MENNKVLALVEHQLYGNITSDQEVINTKHQLLADLEQDLADTINTIVNSTVNEINKLHDQFGKEYDMIINSKPQVTDYPVNGILTIRLVTNE